MQHSGGTARYLNDRASSSVQIFPASFLIAGLIELAASS
jgi:hypothetical protein